MPRILLVDDEPDILATLAELVAVRFPDADVRTAPDPATALQLLDGVDLVVSDFRMPGMDGLAFLKQVQAQHPSMPSILLTAYNERELAVAAAREGTVRRFFMKPPDVEALLAGMDELLHPERMV